MECITKAVLISSQNSNLLYHIGLLKCFQRDYEEALLNFDIAIEKAEDNIPEYFFYKGLTQALLNNFKDSILDFSIAINIKNDYSQAFL